MQSTKRNFIKGSAALLALVSLPQTLWAAVWPQKVFESTVAKDAIRKLTGTDEIIPTDKIILKVPEIAENGAVVPVTIRTSLENVQAISIVVVKNPRPMAATFEIPPGTLPYIASRIKMGKTSDVMALITTPEGIFSTSKEVKVTIGGCGG